MSIGAYGVENAFFGKVTCDPEVTNAGVIVPMTHPGV